MASLDPSRGSQKIWNPVVTAEVKKQSGDDAAAVTNAIQKPEDNGPVPKPGFFGAMKAAAKEKAGKGAADLSKLMSAKPEMKWQNRAVICNWVVNVVAAAIIADAPLHLGLHSQGLLHSAHTFGGAEGLAAVISLGLILTTIATAYAVHKTGMKPSEYFKSAFKGVGAGTVGVLASVGGAVLVGLVSAKVAGSIAAAKTSTAAASTLHTSAAAGGTHGTVAAAGGSQATMGSSGLAGHTFTASAATTAPATAAAPTTAATTTTTTSGVAPAIKDALYGAVAFMAALGLGVSVAEARRNSRNSNAAPEDAARNSAVAATRNQVANVFGTGGPVQMARAPTLASGPSRAEGKVDPDVGRSLEDLEKELKDKKAELMALQKEHVEAMAPLEYAPEREVAYGEQGKRSDWYQKAAGEIDTRMDRLEELIAKKIEQEQLEKEDL